MTGWADAAALKARPGMGTLTDDQATAAIEAASELLDLLSMRQFGVRSDRVRPEGCGRNCDPGAPSSRAVVGWGLSAPLARVAGPWPLPGPYGGMTDGCGCCGDIWTAAVELQRPVVSVTEVRIDGQVLDPAAYQVFDERLLVRIDGKTWPRCQTMTADPATDLGTFQVIYLHGMPVPALGVQAALSVAAEFVKWWGWVDGDCQLPKRLTTITRQGVSMAVVDPMDIIQAGGTGLPDADLFLAGLRSCRRATIATPGVEPYLRRSL